MYAGSNRARIFGTPKLPTGFNRASHGSTKRPVVKLIATRYIASTHARSDRRRAMRRRDLFAGLACAILAAECRQTAAELPRVGFISGGDARGAADFLRAIARRAPERGLPRARNPELGFGVRRLGPGPRVSASPRAGGSEGPAHRDARRGDADHREGIGRSRSSINSVPIRWRSA